MTSAAPSPTLAARAAVLLGWTPTSWRPVRGGYTPAARFIAARGAERAFVKVATTRLTANMLRREGVVFERLSGGFMPGFIGFEDDANEPILAIEDLSDAQWPPPWDTRTLDAVLEQVEAMQATASVTALESFSAVHRLPVGGWAMVAKDPAPFLALRLTSEAWLSRALPALMAAEAECRTDGPAVCHFDLRSDNICLAATGAKFIDWAAASMGNPRLDLGFWLPSLCFEGGPRPDELLPAAPEIAAWVCGYFAARAGLPIIPDAPFVRRVQREQLTTALPWVARALKLGEL